MLSLEIMLKPGLELELELELELIIDFTLLYNSI
jgi:hypothetical protein